MNLKVCCLIIFVFVGTPIFTRSSISAEKPTIRLLSGLQANLAQDNVPVKKLAQAQQNATTNTVTSGSAVSESSNEIVTIALITAGGAALGALIAAIAAAYSAQIKIREITLNYEHQLRDKYLSNAREYTKSLYVPLNIALTELSEAYQTLRLDIDFDKKSAPENALEQFTVACDNYLVYTTGLLKRGADTFLTPSLDEGLRSLNVFLKRSLLAKSPIVKVVLEYRLAIPGPFKLSIEDRISKEVPMGREAFRSMTGFGSPGISMSLWYLGRFSVRYSEILAAPIATREFEERIMNEVPALKAFIKQVTLGSHIDL